MVLANASEPIIGPSPCYLLWPPLPLHRHLQLAPAAEYVHTTGSNHHHCLPCYQSWRCHLGAQKILKPQNSCSACQGPHSCQYCGPQCPGAKETSYTIGPSATMHLSTWHSASLDQGHSITSKGPYQQIEGFP